MLVFLASNSPRRKELLARIIPQKSFVAIGSNIREEIKEGEDAETYCQRIAEEKARDVIDKHRKDIIDAVAVIGADTVILFNNQIGTRFARAIFPSGQHLFTKMLGRIGLACLSESSTLFRRIRCCWNCNLLKFQYDEIIRQPKDTDDAKRILKKLSGKCHEVITGVAVVILNRGETVKFAVKSKVWMKNLSDEVIEEYIKSGEPMDKAGAYAIQGLGKKLIKKFEGSYTNIIGLPIEELREALDRISGSRISEGQGIKEAE